MRNVPIASIELEPDGTLLVRPGDTDRSSFRFIYRDATGVEWRESDGSFYPYRLGGVPPQGWFRIVTSAARNELGVNLQVTFDTIWINVESDLRQAIETEAALVQSNNSLQRP